MRLGGEAADDVVLGLALAVRGVRLGSVCVDLATVRGTVLGAGDELVDVSGLPWPDPGAWVAACAASPLVADGQAAPDGRARSTRRDPGPGLGPRQTGDVDELVTRS